MYSKTIISCSLPYLWQEAVKFVRNSKEIIEFGGGMEVKHARDSQVQLIADKHCIQDALNHVVHPSDPFCTENTLREYIKEYTKEFKSENFSYTYYDELTNSFGIDLINKLKDGLLFQINTTYVDKNGVQKKGLASNRNVVTLLNNTKWDMMSSLPCWNILWIRLHHIDEDGTIWVSVSTWYRSHDLTDAWESNFIAQVTMIQKEILDKLNAKIFEWTEANASLHIYEHNIPTAEKIKIVSISPNLLSLQSRYNKMNI